jgi:D-sedoheptulose 7-phosphate isomerase
MDDLSPTSYFQTLTELWGRLRVTNPQGVACSLEEGCHQAMDRILSVQSEGKKVMAIGNGGSAAIASHMQLDLANAVGVRAMVFHEPFLLKALSNDHGYATVFERLLSLWVEQKDLLVAISSSGQSENVLRGVRVSLERGCGVITLSGFRADNPLRRMGHLNFYVPSQTYGYVELAHSILAHFLTDGVLKRIPAGALAVR